MALTKGARTGNGWLLISKLYLKGASEVLRLEILLKLETVGSVFSFLTQLTSSTPIPVFLGVVPSYEHRSEDTATSFLATNSSGFALNALRETTLFQVRHYLCIKVCVYFISVHI